VRNLKLKFARIEKGLSQIELAKRIGVTRQTIGMIEAGDYNPTLKLCLAICRELGKTLDDLFWEEDSHEEEK
jgi:putative transcriptional regulator